MDFVFGKLLSCLITAVIALGVLYLFLLLAILWRQRKTIKKMEQVQKSIAATLEDAAGHQRVSGEKLLNKIVESFKVLDPVAEAVAELDRKLSSINQILQTNQTTLTDSLMEISSSVNTAEKSDDELYQIRERIDKIQADLSQAHRWLDELRLLEKVVIKLIGPDKLRSLIEKERGLLEARPAGQATASAKKSLL